MIADEKRMRVVLEITSFSSWQPLFLTTRCYCYYHPFLLFLDNYGKRRWYTIFFFPFSFFLLLFPQRDYGNHRQHKCRCRWYSHCGKWWTLQRRNYNPLQSLKIKEEIRIAIRSGFVMRIGVERVWIVTASSMFD